MMIVHLTIAAVWLGSMIYSLAVVQPTVRRFFRDESRREDFLLALAHGNRWRVVALVGVLLLSAAWVMVTTPQVLTGYAAASTLYAIAAAIFCNVSWRHWPARVFALAEERAGYERRLRIQALAILCCVSVAFLIALGVSV
jgi:uncharacterized membrane protein